MADQDFQQPSQLGEMHIEEFDKERHSVFVSEWLKARDMSDDVVRNLPLYGFIAYEYDVPVASVFLRQVEGKFGLIDGLCSNPYAPPEIRNIAIDTLTQQLIETAKKLSLKMLYAWTEDSNTLERSSRHGFNRSPAAMITYDLSGSSGIH